MAGAAIQDGRDRVARALAPFGFTDDGHAGRWQSRPAGRVWTVTFSPDRRTKYYGEVRVRDTIGFRLRIDVAVSVMMRVYVLRSGVASNPVIRRIHRWRGLHPLPSPVGVDGRFEIVTIDPVWTSRLVVQPRAAAALDTLVEFREAAGASSSVYVEPGGLHYASPRWQISDIEEARIGAIVTALGSLAEEAERQPPPERPAQLNWLERFFRTRPYLAAILSVGGIMTVLVALTVLLMTVAWLVFG